MTGRKGCCSKSLLEVEVLVEIVIVLYKVKRSGLLRRRYDRAKRRDLARVHHAGGMTECGARHETRADLGTTRGRRNGINFIRVDKKRGTWTHSTGDPPETDNKGGRKRNGHGPRTHETDTPTGNVCTNIIIQQESRAHTRKPMFTP